MGAKHYRTEGNRLYRIRRTPSGAQTEEVLFDFDTITPSNDGLGLTFTKTTNGTTTSVTVTRARFVSDPLSTKPTEQTKTPRTRKKATTALPS